MNRLFGLKGMNGAKGQLAIINTRQLMNGYILEQLKKKKKDCVEQPGRRLVGNN